MQLTLIIVFVFLGVFAVVLPVLLIAGKGTSDKSKQVLATLDTALDAHKEQAQEKDESFRKDEMLSAIPWMNNLLQSLDLATRLHTLLNQADLKWTPAILLFGCVAGFAIPSYLLHLETGDYTLPLLAGLAGGAAPLGFVFLKRAQRFGKFEQQLPDALDLMVSALRVGHGLSAALGLVTRECPAPLSGEFRICYDEHNFGLDLRTALENLIARVPLQDIRIVVTAIVIQKESGGNLAEVLEKTAYVIRQRFRLKKQIMVHTAQGRLTGLVLTVLPILAGIGLYIVNPHTTSLLWTSPIGIKMLYVAGAMLVTGTLIIQKIVHMDV
jgi:tight adherence protein B